MKSVPIADIRNVVIMGHTGSGKTTLTEAVLHRLGISERLGSVVAGTSVSDFTEEEKARKTSIYASTFVAKHAIDGRPYEFVWTDTPGYADFYGQMVAAARAADVALIAVDAVAGVQVGAMRAWRLCEAQGKARGIVITGLDRDNASFEHAMESIRNAWGALCVPVMLPTTDHKGVVDVLAPRNAAGDLAEGVEAAKQGLVEKAAETDDQLIEKYLNGEDLSADEVSNGLRHAVAASAFVPVFVCLALQEIGIAELLDGVARLFPSPAEIAVKDAAGNTVDTARARRCGAGLAVDQRSVRGPIDAGARVGGTLKEKSEIFNATKGAEGARRDAAFPERQEAGDGARGQAGDIVALAKLKATVRQRHPVHAGASPVTMAPIVFPKPVVAACRARAKTRATRTRSARRCTGWRRRIRRSMWSATPRRTR
jgi:elongation factor G